MKLLPMCPQCGEKRLMLDSKTKGGKQRYICKKNGARGTKAVYCYSTTNPNAPARDQRANSRAVKGPPAFKQTIKGKRFIVTAAQNATPVHAAFFKSLRVVCAHLGAQMLVIPLRYKNPTSIFTESQEDADHWAAEVVPFLCNQRQALNKNLTLLADAKTQPTATQPLSGYEGMTHGESGIVGHTKLAFKTVATPQAKFPKILVSTGACTLPNYTDSRAGKVGEFHHTLGAALVEIDGDRFHLRQLNADKSGSFYDLDTHYTPEGVTAGHRAAALVMGDTHVDYIDPAVEAATFGKGGMVAALDPEQLVWHDLCEGYAVNPHHFGNVFNAIAKMRGDRRDAKAEMERALAFVDKRTPANRVSVIVASNHNDFLRRWIIAHDWRDDADNAEFYLETALDMVRQTKHTAAGAAYPNAFNMWANRLLSDRSRFRVLESDESHVVAGIELGMHGDRGPNGARGSIKNLRRIGVRSIIGHSHSPGIDEGAYQVGTSTHLRLEYNAGPSSWLNTHCVIYPNGKRCLLTMIDGKWRL